MGSVLGTSFHCLSVGNTTTLLTQIITGSFVTGGGTDGAVMEKMDVDDDAVVDLSVKYVHWYLSEFCQLCTTTLLLGMGVAKTFVEHTVYLVMMALLETHFHCNPLNNCSLINWQLQTYEI
jgi:hypothetical protein